MEDPAKKAAIDAFVIVLKSVLDGRKRLFITYNVTAEQLEASIATLPSCMAPTVSPLHHGAGFAVQVCLPPLPFHCCPVML